MRPVAPEMDAPRRPSNTQKMDDEAIEAALRAGGDHAAADRIRARRERRLTMLPPAGGSSRPPPRAA